jgi:hypothetical protein
LRGANKKMDNTFGRRGATILSCGSIAPRG